MGIKYFNGKVSNKEVYEEIDNDLLKSVKELKNIVDIKVCIVVDRDNLKKIIIGKNGTMLKNI